MEKTLLSKQQTAPTPGNNISRGPRCCSSPLPSLPQVGHKDMLPGERKFQSLGWRTVSAGVQLSLEARTSSWDTPLDSGGCRSKPTHHSNSPKHGVTLWVTQCLQGGAKPLSSTHDPGVSPLSFHGQLQPWQGGTSWEAVRGLALCSTLWVTVSFLGAEGDFLCLVLRE